jgi:hypothetical protein
LREILWAKTEEIEHPFCGRGFALMQQPPGVIAIGAIFGIDVLERTKLRDVRL